MPKLETLTLYFTFPIPNHDVESQLTHTPVITPVTQGAVSTTGCSRDCVATFARRAQAGK